MPQGVDPFKPEWIEKLTDERFFEVLLLMIQDWNVENGSTHQFRVRVEEDLGIEIIDLSHGLPVLILDHSFAITYYDPAQCLGLDEVVRLLPLAIYSVRDAKLTQKLYQELWSGEGPPPLKADLEMSQWG